MKKLFFVLLPVLALLITACTKEELAKINGSDQTSVSEPTENKTTQVSEKKYLEYSPEVVSKATGKKVLFFHAKWCPTCKAANEDFTKNESLIPNGVLVFKTDYDTETELKKKYNITYQHTFVQIDDKGELLSSWSGGSVKELPRHIK